MKSLIIWLFLCLFMVACSSGPLVGGGCAEGFSDCAGECVDLSVEVLNCGACGLSCENGEVCQEAVCIAAGDALQSTGGTGQGGASAGSSGRGISCDEPPLSNVCGGACVDILSDAAHCGSCGDECESGICISGVCEGARGGHLIAICQDYQNYALSAARLLANAVFLAPAPQVKVLSYAQYTPGPVIRGVERALQEGAELLNRQYEITRTVEADDIGLLNRKNFDVLLVYDQPDASSGVPLSLAKNWEFAVQEFVDRGGVVVVTTGGVGIGEMPELISRLGIINTSGTQNYDEQVYHLQTPGDAVALGVVSSYRALAKSCTFETDDTPSSTKVFVTTDTAPESGVGAPAVVHRLIFPVQEFELR